MSTDIHFAAAASVSETASVGRPRAARNVLTRATRSCSAASRLAPAATCGANETNRLPSASMPAQAHHRSRIDPPVLAGPWFTQRTRNGRVWLAATADRSDLDSKRLLAYVGPAERRGQRGRT